MRKPKKIAPKKLNFYLESDFTYELSLSREYSDSDAIAVIILYRIDTVKTVSNNIYGESKAKDKKYLEPIELNVTLEITTPETAYKSKTGIFDEKINKLIFGIYKQELDEKNCIINRGDFFKYFDGEKDRTFEITKVSNIDSNNSTLGYKPYYKLVESVMVLDDAFIG